MRIIGYFCKKRTQKMFLSETWRVGSIQYRHVGAKSDGLMVIM